ncbi:MAG: hypothetical protein R3D59_14145 [Paracoccaceae bacterium]
MLNNHRDRVQDASRRAADAGVIVIGPVASRLSYFAALVAALGLGVALKATIWLVLPGALALWLGHAMWHWPISARLNRPAGADGGLPGFVASGRGSRTKTAAGGGGRPASRKSISSRRGP